MIFRNKLTRVLSILLLLMMNFLVGCDDVADSTDISKPDTYSDQENNVTEKASSEVNKEVTSNPTQVQENEEHKEVVENKVETTENLEVHYIDVGQGDAILIKQGDSSMLIDAGDNVYGKTVVNYLKNNNISHLNYVIGTHPHADHIGGMDDVINTFSIGKIIMPQVNHNTKTFEDVILAIKSKGLKITTPKVSDTYAIGNGSFTILAPNSSSYDDLNDYSVMAKLTYGNNSFMFTGDAEQVAEGEIIDNSHNLKSDVLKVGHHGSNTSTTSEFLETVDPKYAVIQVGSGNRYGHPTQATLEKLQTKGIDIYRSDLHGNIIATSNGNTVTFNTKPSKVVQTQKDNQEVAPITPITTPPAPVVVEEKVESASSTNTESYIGNKNSHIIHRPDCSTLPNENNRVYFSTKDEGINSRYRGCKRCNP